MSETSDKQPDKYSEKHSDEHLKEREHFFGAAKLVAALTMASRVLGLVRDMVIIPLGGRALADCFWMAFSIPNLFRRLFGEGALSAAFVPVFTEVAETKGPDRARAVLANVAGVLAVVLAGLVVLIALGLWAAWEIWSGDATRLFLLRMTALMLPFMFTVCLLALGSAALNCRGHFAYPAFAPIILNVGLIAGAAWAAPALAQTDVGQFYIVGLSLLAAGLVQLLGVIWLLGRAGLGVVVCIRPLLDETRRIARLMAPMLIPLSVMQFSAFADRLVALIFTTTPNAPLAEGIVPCLHAANRLFQLPLGVLAISIATVIFPLLGRYALRDDRAGLLDVTNRALRLSLFLGIPAGVALMYLAEPLIALLFQRRNFSAFDTARTAQILRMYCLGMWAYFCNHILLRAFFAIRQVRWPMILACSLVVANLAMVLVGIHTPLRGSAIGLATAITAGINAILLLWYLRRQWGQLGLRRIAWSLLRIALATAAMATAVWVAMDLLGETIRRMVAPAGVDWLKDLATLAAAVLAGAGTYLLAAVALRCPELKELLKSKG